MTLHGHYFKDVSNLETIDVYRVLELFNVVNPCVQHAVKKLLVAGGRGAGKDMGKDIQEAIDSLQRWQGMRSEEATRSATWAESIVTTANNRIYDLLLGNDGQAYTEARRYLKAADPELYETLARAEEPSRDSLQP